MRPTKASDEGKVRSKSMRKIQILALALVTVCAFSALITASASATLTFTNAKWLVNNAEASGQLADSTGELTFLNLANTGEIRCSGLFEGTVEAAGKDLITMVYSLEPSQRLITELSGEGILCTSLKVCDAGTAEIWPVGLPWPTQALLDESLFYELIEKGEYHIKCKVGVITAEETCAAQDAVTEVLNIVMPVAGVEAMGIFEPEGTCNGAANTGQITNVAGNLTTLPGGGTLTISD
jgi:hypothetical protein